MTRPALRHGVYLPLFGPLGNPQALTPPSTSSTPSPASARSSTSRRTSPPSGARQLGATWEAIGAALGVSKQAVQQRWGAVGDFIAR